jgi:tape measure domain-containing protein
MAAQNEVELLIRAKNLSTKTISQLNSELGKIADNQEQIADANKLAERSFESLKSEQQQLLAIMKSLNDRAGKLNAYERQEQQVRALREQLNAARGNLNALAQQFYNTEKPTKEFNDQLKAAGGEVTRLESQLRNSERRLETTGNKLREMGVDTTRFAQSQQQVNSALNSSLSAYKRATDNVERYDAAVAEVRATQQAARDAERATAQEARESAAKLDAAAQEREQALKRERQFAELTANVYRTLAREREKAAAAGAAFRAGGAQALAAARATSAPAVGSGASLGGAAAGVQAVLDPAKEAVATLDRLEKEVGQLEKEFSELTPEAIRAGEGMEKLADQSKRLREAASALRGQAGLADELSKQNAALVQSQQHFEAARLEVIEYAQAVQRAETPNDELAASLARAQAGLRNAQAELSRQTEAFNRVEARARAAGVTLNNLNGIEQRLTATATRVANGQRQVAETMGRVESATAKADTKLKAFNNGQRTALSLYQRSRGQLLSLVSAYVGVFGAINLVGSAMDAAIEREKVMSRLMIATGGDAAEAGREYDYLRAKADELGLAFGPLANSYSRFAVAARDAGMSAEATRYIFESFSEASTVLRLSADETEGAFKALEQIFSKGFIQAEELRGQLGDRLTGAFNLFAKAIGVSTEELNKMLEKGGEVRAEFVLLAAQQARGIYGPQAKEAANSMLGDLNRLQNAWGDLKREVIDGGLGDALRDLFQDLTTYLKSDDGRVFAQNLTKVFVAAANAAGELVKVMAENQEVITFAADAAAFLIRNFKTLLALMLAIQGARIAIVFTQLATEILKARAATLALNTALGAGTAASAGRAGAAVTALIGGPIAALLAIAAAGIIIPVVIQMKQEADALKVQADVGKTLAQLNRGFSQSERNLAVMSRDNAQTLQQRVEAAQKLLDIYDKQKDSLREQIAQNVTIRKNQQAVRVAQGTRESDANLGTKQFEAMRQVEDEGKALEAQLAQLERRANPLRDLVKSASRDLGVLQKKEQQAGADKLSEEFKRIQAAADAAAARAGEGKEDAGDKQAREKLASDRIKLAEETAKTLREIDDDLLRTQEKNLDAQIQLVKSEFEVRRQEIQKLIEEAKKLGLGDEAAQLEASLIRLQTLEDATVKKTTTEFNTAKLAENEQKINDLLTQRSTELDTINTLLEAGMLTQGEASLRIEEVNGRMLPQLQAMAEAARQFIMTLGNSPEALAALANLNNLNARIASVGKELSTQKRQVIDVFVNGFGQAFAETATLIADTLKGVQNAGDAWKAFGDIVLNTIADILVQLGQMIIQQALFNALKAAAENAGGGWGAIISQVASYIKHDGGVVGQAGKKRSVSAAAFAAPMRYHTGGIAGLAADEVPAILKRNEEVLTESDPRHRFNGGMAGGASTPTNEISIINTIDSESVVAAGANTRAGRTAIFNAVKADRASFKKLLA